MLPRIDLNSITREEYSNAIIHEPIPDNAASEWREQATDLKDLVSKLAFHPAMEPNLQQTYMTPAISKNKVYFMWDFVTKTYAFLENIPPTKDFSGSPQIWTDVITRSMMAAELILDSKPGMLDMLVESTYPGAASDRPVIGDDIKAAAERLKAR